MSDPLRLTAVDKPHDRAFKKQLQNSDIAKDMIRHYFDKEVLELLDWDSLYLANTTHVDSELKEYLRDVVYYAKSNTQHPVQLCFLMEHMSKVDRFFGLRVLQYTLNVWSNYIEQNSGTKTIPLVFACVFYNGKHPWKYSLDLRDYIDAPEGLIEKYVMKPAKLIDFFTV